MSHKIITSNRACGSDLLFLAGMANGVRFFAPPYWKIDACAKPAGRNRIMRMRSAAFCEDHRTSNTTKKK